MRAVVTVSSAVATTTNNQDQVPWLQTCLPLLSIHYHCRHGHHQEQCKQSPKDAKKKPTYSTAWVEFCEFWEHSLVFYCKPTASFWGPRSEMLHGDGFHLLPITFLNFENVTSTAANNWVREKPYRPADSRQVWLGIE